jgi:hypothetical protein
VLTRKTSILIFSGIFISAPHSTFPEENSRNQPGLYMYRK